MIVGVDDKTVAKWWTDAHVSNSEFPNLTTQDEQRDLIQAAIKQDDNRSDNDIAKELGISHNTVASVRRTLSPSRPTGSVFAKAPKETDRAQEAMNGCPPTQNRRQIDPRSDLGEARSSTKNRLRLAETKRYA